MSKRIKKTFHIKRRNLSLLKGINFTDKVLLSFNYHAWRINIETECVYWFLKSHGEIFKP